MNRFTSRLVRRIWRPWHESRIATGLADYVAERVAPAIGACGGDMKIEEIAGGRIAIVRRLRVAGGATLILRAWPWNPARSRVREHCTVSGLFREAGVRVPDIILADSSMATMRRRRLEAVVENEAEGGPPDFGIEGGALEDFAIGLARLHAVRSPVWGKPWLPGDAMAEPCAHRAGRLSKFRDRTEGRLLSISDEEFAGCMAWLERRVRTLGFGARASLIHGDLSVGNLFADGEGRITWIDFGSAQYGMPEQDLALVHFMLGEGRELDRFMRIYHEHKPRDFDVDPGAVTFFKIMRMIERISSRSRRRARHESRGEGAVGAEQEQARAERTLRALMRSL